MLVTVIVGFLGVNAVFGAAKSPLVEKLYVERMRTSDLDSSATGYMYRNDGTGPGTYITLGNKAAGDYLQARSE